MEQTERLGKNNILTEEKWENIYQLSLLLKYLRVKYGYTQTDIGSKINTTKNYISSIENGKAPFSIHFLIKYLAIFNIDLIDLIKDKLPKNS